MLKRTDPIEKLDLSVRAYNCLKYAGIKQIKDLEGKSCKDFKKIPNFGFKCFRELVTIWAEKFNHKISYYDKILTEKEILEAENAYKYYSTFPNDIELKLVW